MNTIGLFLILLYSVGNSNGILFPRQSETRELMSLDGLWNFVVDIGNVGYSKKWHSNRLDKLSNVNLMLMPVPSSYNDIVEEANIRDHAGLVWYDRSFYVPKSWIGKKVWLRFGSVHYSAEVWINNNVATQHEIGHLPFEVDVSKLVVYGKENWITVACDNTLLPTTIPQGNHTEVDTDDGLKIIQTYTFDFFNYAGIHRPVVLYTTPTEYIQDITVETRLARDNKAIIAYNIISCNINKNNLVGVKLYDSEGNFVTSNSTAMGILVVTNPKLWWPYLMDPKPGYLYTLQIHLLNKNEEPTDIYRQKIGIRELKWTNSTFTINKKPIYFHGFGKHEDADLRGKGLDFATITKDFNLIRWIGGNAFRTSHYPYAEEIMDMADRLGIMVIDECPAVNIEHFSNELQLNHMQSLTELVMRDKNRPSVIAWSIANEPRSDLPGADKYFKIIANHAKSLDNTRPITASLNVLYDKDQLGQFLDVISFNRYNAWYINPGRLDMITKNVIKYANAWRNKHNKTVLISEYGADSVAGLHFNPEYIWSEEYQVTLLSNHFKAFDKLRENEWFIGEFIWNFADFNTAQTITRVAGNKKGVFTRNRQPKAAAFHLRKRYFRLAKELFNATIPEDVRSYVSRNVKAKNEL